MPELTLVCLRAQDWTDPVLPAGAAHETCVRCRAVVLLLADCAPLNSASSRVLCLACAAVEGNQSARDLFWALFHKQPEPDTAPVC
jgi:hypothetical protein